MLTPDKLIGQYLNNLEPLNVMGVPMHPDDLQDYIDQTRGMLEQLLGIRIAETIVKMGSYPLPGERLDASVPTLTRDGRDMDPRDFEGDKNVNIKLPYGPVREVHSVGIKFPYFNTTSQLNPKWVIPLKDRRAVQIFPVMGTTPGSQILAGLTLARSTGQRIIPAAWHVSYTAGFTSEQLQNEWPHLLGLWGKMAAVQVLVPGSISLNFANGVSSLSVSVDGLSNSTNLMQNSNALVYQALINEYQSSIDKLYKQVRSTLSGVELYFV